MPSRGLICIGLLAAFAGVALAGDLPKPAEQDSRSIMRVVRDGDDVLAKFGEKAAKLTTPEGEFTVVGAKITRVAKDGDGVVVYATLRRASKPAPTYYFKDEADAIMRLEASSVEARLAFRGVGDNGAAKERAKLRRQVDIAEYDEKTVKQAIRTAADARKSYYEKVDVEVVVRKVLDPTVWNRRTELKGRVRVLETSVLESREFDVMLPTSTPGIVKSERRLLELPPVIGRLKCEWIGDLK